MGGGKKHSKEIESDRETIRWSLKDWETDVWVEIWVKCRSNVEIREREFRVQGTACAKPWAERMLGALEASVARAAYLKERVVGNKGRELARQDCTGDGKDFGFYAKYDETIARHYLVMI